MPSQEDEAEDSAPAPSAARGTRRPSKPLSQRRPLVPAFFAVLCIFGGVFTIVLASSHTVITKSGHHQTVYGSPSGFNLAVGIFYFVLAGVEAFIAYRIYRARGGWR